MAKTEKNKKDKKRRLLLLLLLLVLTFCGLGTATYAWFTSNRSVSVDPIDVNVTTVNGLQISADGQTWKAKVTKDDLTGAINTYTTAQNQFPDTVSAVSTDGTVANGRMNMFFGSVDADQVTGDYMLTATKQSEINCNGDTECAGHHFIAFDVFLKVDAETDIVLTSNSSVVQKTPTDRDTGIKNAARVGFINEGHAATGASVATIQALQAGTTANRLIWEPNMDTHTKAGIDNALLNYGISITNEAGEPRITYKGVKQAITTPIKLTETMQSGNSAYFGTVTPNIATIYGFTDDQTFMTLEAGVTKVRVYMWVEGQDVDAENNATGSHMAFNVEFAIA